MKFYDGNIEVGEVTTSEPPLNSGSPGEYAFQTKILLSEVQTVNVHIQQKHCTKMTKRASKVHQSLSTSIFLDAEANHHRRSIVRRDVLIGALLIGNVLSFTACNVGPVVDPPQVPTQIRLESSSTNVTASGNLTLTAKIKYEGSQAGGVETRVEFYDGDLEVGETTISDPPLNSGLQVDYAFKTTILISKAQNGARSYTAKALYENDKKTLVSTPIVVNVNIP
ncbi:MAG: hypothetical protein HC933_04095 [Pleurocapsa sp. SU_196_0]|nr:hypothetical protein [Pleurocapsa sp. SU_196_0]